MIDLLLSPGIHSGWKTQIHRNNPEGAWGLRD